MTKMVMGDTVDGDKNGVDVKEDINSLSNWHLFLYFVV